MLNYSTIKGVLFIEDLAYNQDNSRVDIILEKTYEIILDSINRYSEKFPDDDKVGNQRKKWEELETLWNERAHEIESSRTDINISKILQFNLQKIRLKVRGNMYVQQIPYNWFSITRDETELSLNNKLFLGLDPIFSKHHERTILFNDILSAFYSHQDITSLFNFAGIQVLILTRFAMKLCITNG